MEKPSSTKLLRDAVHGDIHLPSAYLPVLDAREMQRLRGVHQLGTAFHVYPSAQHTRFEHCLGTFHVASVLIDRIRANHRADPASSDLPSTEEEQTMLLASLVHDISHIPYGHSFEDQDGLLPRHDTAERLGRALGRGEIAAALEDLGAREAVLGCLTATAEEIQRPCVRELVAGSVCADLLDYLKRDAYFTGLRVSYDERLFDSFKIDPHSGHLYIDLTKHHMDREDVLSELLNLFRIRYVCSERIYYHHAKVASGALLSRAVELCLATGLPPAALESIGDGELEAVLLTHARQYTSRHAALERVPELTARFRQRKLPKRCFVATLRGHEELQDELVAHFVDNQAYRREVEAEIGAALGLPDAVDVVVYCPKKSMQLKEASILVRRAGRELTPLDHYRGELPMLDQMLRDYRYLWKLYVFVPRRDRAELEEAGRTVESVLRTRFPDISNSYRR
jgi:HD superfamily phosphohydrolase